MGHYDEHYEAEADESRKWNKLKRDAEYMNATNKVLLSDLSAEEKTTILAVLKAKHMGVIS